MVSYALETGGRAEVTAVLRSNFEAVKQNGFSIDSIDHGQGINGWRPSMILNAIPNTQTKSTVEGYDYVVVTTKNIPDVSPTVVDLIEPAITPGHTTIILIQNGINIDKPIRQKFPTNTVLSGVQLIGAEETSPGVILHNERDRCRIGVFIEGKSEVPESDRVKAQLFIDAYNACGKVDCRYDTNVERTRWLKLVYNASFNSVAAALNMNVTQMRLSEHIIDDLVKPIMHEIMNISSALGHHVPETLITEMIMVDGLESWFMPSMGQDVARGNLIEFENIVGEPVRTAQELGVPCPTLTAMYGILRGIQTRTKLARGLLVLDARQPGRYSRA